MSSIYKPVHKTIDVAAATTVKVSLPQGSKNHVLRMGDGSVAWTIGSDEATVTAGNGFPVLSSEVYPVDGPVILTDQYVRHGEGTTQTLHWSYEYATKR